MNAWVDRLRQLLEQKMPSLLRQGGGSVAVWISGGVIFFMVMFVITSKNRPEQGDKVDVETNDRAVSPVASASRVFLDEEVDRKAFVARLEKQYEKTRQKTVVMEKRLRALDRKVKDMDAAQGALHAMLMAPQASADSGGKEKMPEERKFLSPPRLEVVSMTDPKGAVGQGTYIPAGSFVHGVLLTGVFAPGRERDPLPVLIRLGEAFVGPNNMRVPLQGAFVVGKAVGDLNSARALIQAVRLAAVLPDGAVFETQGNIGYITDQYGELGLPGVVVHNTGTRLAASFLSGFLGGAAQAVADAETTTTVSDGSTRNAVTGSTGRHALFSGMAASAGHLSEQYASRMDEIVPAVRVRPGVEVVLVVLEGVRVHGLEARGAAGVAYPD